MKNNVTAVATSATAIHPDHVSFESVQFLNQDIDCVLINNNPYVVFKSLVENIGLHWITAFAQIKKDEVLSQALVLTLIPNPKYKGQQVLCMPIKLMPGWLFSVSINRVSESVKPVLLAYRKDVYDVLFNHYFGKTNTAILEMANIETEISELKKQRAEINTTIKDKEKRRREIQLSFMTAQVAERGLLQ
jgi:P22_AR N-terminal domain.